MRGDPLFHWPSAITAKARSFRTSNLPRFHLLVHIVIDNIYNGTQLI